MRALVEASAAFDQTAGIGRYSRNLLRRLPPLVPEWDWCLLHAPAPTRAPGIPSDWLADLNAEVVRVPMSRRRADQVWFRARLPLDAQLFAGRAGLLYSPDFTAPPALRVPRVITVHDLAFLTHPEHTTSALRSYLAAVVPREVARADVVAVVSEATRNALVDLLRVPAERVVVVRNGVEDRFFDPPPLTARQRAELGVPERFLLMVGTIEPRKNHLNVLRALATLPPGERLPLMIAGRPGWGCEETMATARQMEADGLLRLLDHVPEGMLPSLYATADAVLYPSWTEGFGLPILEAFAAGTPVVTGVAPALREVAGSLATHVEPGDVDAVAGAIAEVTHGGEGPGTAADRVAWARGFTWDAPASRLASMLRAVARPA